MRKSAISSALLAAALICSPLAIAATSPQTNSTQPTPMHHHRSAGHHMHKHRHGRMLFHKLDLSDSQQTSIHQIMKQDHAKVRSEWKALREKRMALEKATPGTADYQNAANALAKASANAASARVMHRTDSWAKIYKILTPTQRTKLAKMRAHHRAQRQKWHKAHMHHHMQMPASSASTK